MKIYKHQGQILSIVYRDADWVEGLNFITPNEMFVQVGFWWYHKGKKLASHVHNDFESLAMRTHEMIYVKKGSFDFWRPSEYKIHLAKYLIPTVKINRTNQLIISTDLGNDSSLKNIIAEPRTTNDNNTLFAEAHIIFVLINLITELYRLK